MPDTKTAAKALKVFLNKLSQKGGNIAKAWFVPADGEGAAMVSAVALPGAIEMSVVQDGNNNLIIIKPKTTISGLEMQLKAITKQGKQILNGYTVTSVAGGADAAEASTGGTEPAPLDDDDDEDDKDPKAAALKKGLLKKFKAWERGQGAGTPGGIENKLIKEFATAIRQENWKHAANCLTALERSAASRGAAEIGGAGAAASTAGTKPKGPSPLQGKTLGGDEDPKGNNPSPLQGKTLRGDEDVKGKRPSPLQGRTLRGHEDADEKTNDDYSPMPGAPADTDDDYSPMPGAPAGSDTSDDDYSPMPGAPIGSEDTADDTYSAMPGPPEVDAETRASHKQDLTNLVNLYKNIQEKLLKTEDYGKTSPKVARFLKGLGNLQGKLKSPFYDVDDFRDTAGQMMTLVLEMETAANAVPD